jgi:alpha-glucosidase
MPAMFQDSAFRVWKAMPEEDTISVLATNPDRWTIAISRLRCGIRMLLDARNPPTPQYKSIPFICAFRNGISYGLFLDNTYRSSFDFGKERSDAYCFGADGLFLLWSRA